MASTLAITSYNRIDQRFAALRNEGRTALVCYVTAGFPDTSRCLELLEGLQHAGADVIEVGVPFSDPIADGPIIQQSSQQALAGGMNLNRVLELVARAQLAIPVVLFSYLNPLIAGGADVLVRAQDAGVDGVLVTDLPLGSDQPREDWLAASELAFIRLVAPTTPAGRMSAIARTGSGFVYLISRLGVTGLHAELPVDLPETAQRLRRATTLPLCIGFGVSTPAHARAVAAVADGVVVGSALVRAAAESVESALLLTRSLRAALDS